MKTKNISKLIGSVLIVLLLFVSCEALGLGDEDGDGDKTEATEMQAAFYATLAVSPIGMLMDDFDTIDGPFEYADPNSSTTISGTVSQNGIINFTINAVGFKMEGDTETATGQITGTVSFANNEATMTFNGSVALGFADHDRVDVNMTVIMAEGGEPTITGTVEVDGKSFNAATLPFDFGDGGGDDWTTEEKEYVADLTLFPLMPINVIMDLEVIPAEFNYADDSTAVVSGTSSNGVTNYTITLDGYSDQNHSESVTGTITGTMTEAVGGGGTATFSGTVTYSGAEFSSLIIDISLTFPENEGPVVTGTVTADGNEFDASDLPFDFGDGGGGDLNADGGVASGGANISGNISFETSTPGEVYVMIFNEEPGENVDPLGGEIINYDGSTAISYSLTNWDTTDTYYIIAWLDENGDQEPNETEQGYFTGPETVTAGDNTYNIYLEVGALSGGGPDGGNTTTGITISGTITIPSGTTGELMVGLFVTDPSVSLDNMAGGDSFSIDGDLSASYAFTNWDAGTYWVASFVDLNSNYEPDVGEISYFSIQLDLSANSTHDFTLE